MVLERERKFLVDPSKLPPLTNGRIIEAGYFTQKRVAIRVTMRSDGVCKICFKGPGAEERQEFEYRIPEADAAALLVLSPTHIVKTRYDHEGWEIDRFHFDHPTLGQFWMAEWEEHEGKPPIPNPLPAWITREVTSEIEYTNMAIAWTFGRKVRPLKNGTEHVSMNVRARPGTKVRFSRPDAGYLPDQERAAKHLKLGQVYSVESTKVGGSHTTVYLQELPGIGLNSVHFEEV